MKTRKEVADHINGADSGHRGAFGEPLPEMPNTVNAEKAAWHWGKCEIRSLLDFIYDGPPAPGEEVWPPLQLRNIAGKRQ